MYTVKGIEFWDHGSPSRKFRVLAIIETTSARQNHTGLAIYHAMTIDGRIAGKAKSVGADAVVPLSAIGQFDALHSRYDLDKKVAAIKYVE